MPGAVQMGPNAVTDPNALIQALQQQQPPKNPATPLERIDPEKEFEERLIAAQVSIERAQPYSNDENILAALRVLHGTLGQILSRADGPTVVMTLQRSVQSLPPAQASGPGGQQPPMGGPPPGGPPAAGPMPAGAPPQGVPLS